jgi:hypothetical protein
MSSLRSAFILLALFTQLSLISAQSVDSATTAARPGVANSGDLSSFRTRLLSAIPPELYEKWRKYGQWDYKQQGFEYRDYTQFNFGATGAASKIDQKTVMALVQAFKPTPEDVKKMDDPDLDASFRRNTDVFEKLLGMAEQDSHLIRIAPEFTWLDSSSKWPRDDIGFSNARWDEYRTLFKSLALTEGIVRTHDFPAAVFFVAHSNGLCTGGSSSGYVYSTAALAPTSKSPTDALNTEARNNPGRHYAYVFEPLKTNWYVFYEVDW